mgnify:CR=1 FL=1
MDGNEHDWTFNTFVNFQQIKYKLLIGVTFLDDLNLQTLNNVL